MDFPNIQVFGDAEQRVRDFLNYAYCSGALRRVLARTNGDFKRVEPILRRMVRVNRSLSTWASLDLASFVLQERGELLEAVELLQRAATAKELRAREAAFRMQALLLRGWHDKPHEAAVLENRAELIRGRRPARPHEFAPDDGCRLVSEIWECFCRQIITPLLGIRGIRVSDQSHLGDFFYGKAAPLRPEMLRQAHALYGVEIAPFEDRCLAEVMLRILRATKERRAHTPSRT